MKKETLNAVLDNELENGVGYQGGQLSKDRLNAMKYFKGEPYGNEVEGRSQVVTREVADTIEAQLPALMKIFTASHEAVQFDPEGPEDEEGAEQESDVVNHVFYKENAGFEILYTWFKDALIQRNGLIKVVWEENEKVERETYTGLDENELAELLSDEYVEPLEFTENEDGTADVAIKRSFPGKVTIFNIPPEEFVISKTHNSVNPKTALCACHRSSKTASDLIEMGFDKAKVDELQSTESGAANTERWERYKDEDYIDTDNSVDKANRKLWLEEFYIRVDYDDDGISELRQVFRVGKTILGNEQVDRSPFCAITPYIMPHSFTGESSADKTMDVQIAKSTVLRQVLDNMYNLNNGRFAVVDGQVNLDDLLTSRPGGVVRQKAPGMVQRLDTPILGAPSFDLLEYLDTIRESRTGITRYNQGMDADSLNKTATGITAIMDASQERLELIARVFAETGVKQMFLDIHELLLKHQTKKKWVKLRNKWTPVSPTEWRDRMNMTINVGLGTGNKQQTQMAMQNIMQVQMNLAQMGLATPENLYNSAKKLVDAFGHNGESFFTLPEPQPPKPDPEEMKAQAEMQMNQAKLQLEQQKFQGDMKIKTGEQSLKERELEMKIEEAAIRLQIEQAKLADGTDADSRMNEAMIRANAEIEKANIESANKARANEISQHAIAVDAETADAKLAMEKYKADLAAETQRNASKAKDTKPNGRDKD